MGCNFCPKFDNVQLGHTSDRLRAVCLVGNESGEWAKKYEVWHGLNGSEGKQ